MLPEKHLNALYSGATCFRLSLPYFEGFDSNSGSHANAEAPVMLGNQTSIPEVAGEAAVFVRSVLTTTL